MLIDSYKYLPRSFRPLYEGRGPHPGEEAPVWTPFAKRLAESRIALLTSAGIYLKASQRSFDLEHEQTHPDWGDPTWRSIPSSARPEDIAVAHLHINDSDILADPEIALPMRTLEQIANEGLIGGTVANHVAVMGYQDRGLRDWQQTTAPEIVANLREQGADGLILAPAWPDCCSNVPVLARWIEAAGIPTVIVTMMPSVAEERRAPRIVGVEFPFGHAFGMPLDRATQRNVLGLALRVLAGASSFGERIDVDIEWPLPLREAYRAWQPKEPSPIVRKLLEARASS